MDWSVVSIISLVWMILFVPLVVCASFLFYKRRDKQPIKARSPFLVLLSNVIFIVFVVTLSMQRILATVYPCVLNLWQGYIGMIAIGNIYALRSWILYCQFNITRRQLRANKNTFEALQAAKKFMSTQYLLSRVLAISLPLFLFPLYTTIYVEKVRTGTGVNCVRGLADFVLSVVTGCYIIFFVWLGLKIKVVFDGFGIKDELKASGIGGLIALPVWLVFNTTQLFRNFNTEYIPVSTLGLFAAILWAFYCGTLWPLNRTYNKPPSVSQDLFTNELNTLQGILHSENGLVAFRDFCVSEFSAENILFWSAVEEYRCTIDASASMQRRRSIVEEAEQNTAVSNSLLLTLKKKAETIMTKFIDEGAPLQVNLPFNVNESLRATMNSNLYNTSVKSIQNDAYRGIKIDTQEPLQEQTADVSTPKSMTVDEWLHVFDKAQLEIWNLLESDTFSRFRTSKQMDRLTQKARAVQSGNDMFRAMNVI